MYSNDYSSCIYKLCNLSCRISLILAQKETGMLFKQKYFHYIETSTTGLLIHFYGQLKIVIKLQLFRAIWWFPFKSYKIISTNIVQNKKISFEKWCRTKFFRMNSVYNIMKEMISKNRTYWTHAHSRDMLMFIRTICLGITFFAYIILLTSYALLRENECYFTSSTTCRCLFITEITNRFEAWSFSCLTQVHKKKSFPK